MINFLEQAPWYLSVFFVFFGAGIIAITGLLVFRYFVDTKGLKAYHDVAGFTFGLIGVIYAVLLSYIVVDVHDRFNQVHQNMDLEANLAVELYRDSEVFPEDVRNNIKKQIRQYLDTISKGGSEFDTNGAIDPKIHESVAALWKAYYDFEPLSNREKIWYQESIKKLNEFNRARLVRLFNSNTSIGDMMWSILIVGACTIIFFMYFFRVENVKFHALMTGILAGFIALMLFLVQSLDTVFVGDIHVSTDHFIEVKQFLDIVDKEI